MKNAGEMSSYAMMCIPSFVKIGSATKRLVGEVTQTHRQHGDFISLLSFFQNKGNILKIRNNEKNRRKDFWLSWWLSVMVIQSLSGYTL
jgi:hypothetical protein